jgi:hypothetical protein
MSIGHRTIRKNAKRSVRSLSLYQFRKLSDTEVAYMAGFFDGEGYVSCRKRKGSYILVLSIAQKRRQVLEWIREKVGGIIYEKSNPDTANAINFHGFNAAILLRRMFPYLIVKRDETYEAVRVFWLTRKQKHKWPPKDTMVRRDRMRNRKMDRHKLCHADRQSLVRDWNGGKKKGGMSIKEVAKKWGVARSNASRLCYERKLA